MIKIIAVGKIKEKAMKSLIDDYQKRINRYYKLEVIEVKDEVIIKDLDDKIKDIEGQRILKLINDRDYVVCLDLSGVSYDSVDFATRLQKQLDYGINVVFVIGGSLGLSKEVLARANSHLKLSDMTFLHNMARLIIIEQIYRAFKINNNELYHK